jgi:hypothetical protein
VPIRDPQLRIIEFDLDVSDFLGAQTAADFQAAMTPGPSYIVAFVRSNGKRRDPLVIDAMTARILMLSDGTRTAAELVKEIAPGSNVSVEATNLEWIEHLVVCGLIRLCDESLTKGPRRPQLAPIQFSKLGPFAPRTIP